MNPDKIRQSVLAVFEKEGGPFDAWALMKVAQVPYSAPGYNQVVSVLRDLEYEGLILKKNGLWFVSWIAEDHKSNKNISKRCLDCGFVQRERFSGGCTSISRCKNCGGTNMWGEVEMDDGTETNVRMIPPPPPPKKK